MGKKAKHAELIAVKVLREQRWAYERRLDHLSYHEIRLLSSAPVERGGLGYDISEHRLKGLVTGYRERMAEVEAEELDEHRARELADLDRVHRSLVSLIEDPVDRAASAPVAAAFGYRTVDELIANAPGSVIMREDKTRLAALAQLRAVGESRRKLLGIDAPQQIKADIVMHDAVTEELNAMLARAGRPPIEVEK